MLKPPKKKDDAAYYDSRPMERLYALKKRELEFFGNHEEADIRDINAAGFAGIGALIERLQTQYSSYLNRLV